MQTWIHVPQTVTKPTGFAWLSYSCSLISFFQATRKAPTVKVMAIVQMLPVSIESASEGAAQLHTGACSSPAAMGSVSSLISGRPCHKATTEFGPFRLPGAAGSQEPLCHGLPAKKSGYTYASDEDWAEAVSPISPCSDTEDLQDDKPRIGTIRGPPPKLVPVSGKLEKVKRSDSWAEEVRLSIYLVIVSIYLVSAGKNMVLAKTS